MTKVYAKTDANCVITDAVLLTEEEKQEFFPPVEPELSEQERFNAAVLLELAKLKAGDTA